MKTLVLALLATFSASATVFTTSFTPDPNQSNILSLVSLSVDLPWAQSAGIQTGAATTVQFTQLDPAFPMYALARENDFVRPSAGLPRGKCGKWCKRIEELKRRGWFVETQWLDWLTE